MGRIVEVRRINRQPPTVRRDRYPITNSIAMFLILMGTTLLVICSGLDADANKDDRVGTFFEYDYEQDISKCRGEYSGYNEKTRGTGRYEVIEWGPDVAKVNYRWDTTYSNNDGEKKDYRRRGVLEVNLTDRRYMTNEFDLDDPEFRGIPPPEMHVWFFIPKSLREGDKIPMLDSEWTVTNTDKTIWSSGIPRKVIEVTYSSNNYRNDDYGSFNYHFTDRLYFDKDTGFFFAERYEEWDRGSYNGKEASFKITIELDVRSSSYYVEIAWIPFILVYLTIICSIIMVLLGCFVLGHRFRWRSRERMIKGLRNDGPFSSTPVKLFRVRGIKDFPRVKNAATVIFEPFLEQWTRKALYSKDPVVVAVSSDLGLVGYGTYNKEGRIGTILCKNTHLTEELRRFLRCKDFFTESRHMIDITNEMRADPMLMNIINQSRGEVYNVLETNSVYRLDQLYPCKYDSGLVRPMKEKDLKNVSKLAKEIYKTPSKKWVHSSFKAGDIGFVAELSGQIIGFAFAEPCGTHGRVHTLSVHKDHRSKGIAKELNFARLEALRLYGVGDAINEIGDWNLASIRVASIAGFSPISKVYVETNSAKKVKKNIVRR